MGVVDDFKSEKNKNMIILATEKMLKDKYDIVIDREELNVIINSIVFTICSDVILIKSVVKIMELNTVALTKVKEYIDSKKRQNDDNDTQEIKKDIPTDEDVAKYNSEELLTKVLQLEEKRNAINAIANKQINKSDLIQGQSTIPATSAIPAIPATELQNISQISSLSQVSQLPIPAINIYSIIEKLDDVINRKKYINYKSLIINSYNRDWINYPKRNKLSLSVNIDFNKNLIEPDKLLLSKNIKNKTPYITMIISDGKQSQKFQFILSDSSGSSGSQSPRAPSASAAEPRPPLPARALSANMDVLSTWQCSWRVLATLILAAATTLLGPSSRGTAGRFMRPHSRGLFWPI
jgi:hypothetical protein